MIPEYGNTGRYGTCALISPDSGGRAGMIRKYGNTGQYGTCALVYAARGGGVRGLFRWCSTPVYTRIDGKIPGMKTSRRRGFLPCVCVVFGTCFVPHAAA